MTSRTPLVSIIIPALNEEHTISSVLRSLARQERISDCQVIVVDGQSSDNTVEVAGNFPFVHVVSASPGRVSQINQGAAVASASVLWFLHVDSSLPDKRTVDALLRAMDKPNVVGGCFRFHLRGDDFYYRVITAFVNWRARVLGRPYGDQGLFARASAFSKLAGFRKTQGGCDDIDFVLRLRELGEFVLLPFRVETSARTWKRYGKVATTFWHLNQWLKYEMTQSRQKHFPPPPAENEDANSISSAASNAQ